MAEGVLHTNQGHEAAKKTADGRHSADDHSRSSLSAKDAVRAMPVKHVETSVLPSTGQVLVEETKELIEAGLRAIRENIFRKPAWSGAPPPTDDFLLMFLRAETFGPQRAADRYRKFWQTKVALFGETKAASPLRAEDAMAGLNTNVVQFVPGCKDLEGRQVIFVDTSKVDLNVSRTERIMALWYVMLSALEDVETQRRGVCMLFTFKGARLNQIDHKYNKMATDSVQGVLPVRVGSHLMCHPPPMFRVFWVVVSTFMSEKVRNRVRFYVGSDKKVLTKVGKVIATNKVPAPIGPNQTGFSDWLQERVRMEART